MAENGYAKPVLVTTDWVAEHLDDDVVGIAVGMIVLTYDWLELARDPTLDCIEHLHLFLGVTLHVADRVNHRNAS